MAKRMRRIYRAKNGVVDGCDYWCSDFTKPRRGKSQSSSPRKQEANRNQAVHILARKLNNNFTQGDLFLTLTWSDRSWRALRHDAYQAMDNYKRAKKEQKRDALLLQAEKEGKLLIRRLREAGAKDLKYSLVPSDMDGDTKEEARVHLHLVISGEHCAVVKKQMTFLGKDFAEFWPFGEVEYEFLRGGSYAALAAYLLRQTRDIPNRKRYTCSRNFDPIEYEEIELDRNAEPLTAPEGAEVEEYQHDPTNPYGMVYIRYIEPERPATKTRRRGRS